MHTPDIWPALEVSFDDDGLVSLAAPSTGYDDGATVRMHPGQIADLAEKMGLLGKHDPSTIRRIEMLKRRMKVLFDRIDRLDDMLSHCGDHENLDAEKTYSFASWEIGSEFLTDLEADLVAQPASAARDASGTDARQQSAQPMAIATASTVPARSVATVKPQAKPEQPDLLEAT